MAAGQYARAICEFRARMQLSEERGAYSKNCTIRLGKGVSGAC